MLGFFRLNGHKETMLTGDESGQTRHVADLLLICNQFSVMSLEDDCTVSAAELILILYLHDGTLQDFYFLFSKLRCMSRHTQTPGGGETRLSARWAATCCSDVDVVAQQWERDGTRPWPEDTREDLSWWWWGGGRAVPAAAASKLVSKLEAHSHL